MSSIRLFALRLASVLAALSTMWTLPDIARAQGVPCTVADPSPTPLNVRTAPDVGMVVGQLRNGERVRIMQEVRDERGRRWAFVARDDSRQPLGWVFRSFLRCD